MATAVWIATSHTLLRRESASFDGSNRGFGLSVGRVPAIAAAVASSACPLQVGVAAGSGVCAGGVGLITTAATLALWEGRFKVEPAIPKMFHSPIAARP